jgi:predicted HTH transcriptional regulator
MTRRTLRDLIHGGESLTVEFKRKFTSEIKIAKELIAFANSKGGYLLVGVDDDKRIVGVHSEKEEISLLETVCNYYIEPALETTIEVVNIEYEDIVVVRVEESDMKPHRLTVDPQGKYLTNIHERPVYVREGDATLHASKEVVKVLEATNDDSEPVTLSIGKHEKRLFEHLETTQRITAKEFAHISNISERRAIRLLIRLVKIGIIRLYSHEKVEYYTFVAEA